MANKKYSNNSSETQRTTSVNIVRYSKLFRLSGHTTICTRGTSFQSSGKIRLASSVPNVLAPPLGTAGKVASVLTFSLQAPHSFSPPPSFPLVLLHRPPPMLAFSSRSDSSRREVEATEDEEPPCWQLLYLISCRSESSNKSL